MRKSRKKAEGRVQNIPIAAIRQNPAQPRKTFDEESLIALANSIRRYGVLQPLSVREIPQGFELIAGERRLRASALAGLGEVPCLIYRVSESESAELAVVENLLREDLNMFETASAMARLLHEYGLTQEEVAARLSVSQSCVANKLRLLRLSTSLQTAIIEQGLTERHARALLRLPDEKREAALAVMVAKRMNVATAEAYVERELAKQERRTPTRAVRVRGALRSLRFFYNSVDHAMELAKRYGVPVSERREETEDEIRLIISIPKAST